MLLLSLIWLSMGIVIGLVAYIAHLQPIIWYRSKRLDLLSLLIIGALLSLFSGWLGILLFGRLFSIATALWIPIIGVVLLPRGIARLQVKQTMV